MTIVVGGLLLATSCSGTTGLSAIDAQAQSSASTIVVSSNTATVEPTPAPTSTTASTPEPSPTPTPVFIPMEPAETDPAATPEPDPTSMPIEGDGGGKYSSTGLLSEIGTIEVGDVIMRLSRLQFHHSVQYVSGPDIDDKYVTVSVEFDRPHDFEAWDFRLLSPTNDVFRADFFQEVPQNAGSLRFTIETELTSSIDWILRVSSGDDVVDVDL